MLPRVYKHNGAASWRCVCILRLCAFARNHHVVRCAAFCLVDSVTVCALTDVACCCCGFVQVEGVMTCLTKALQLTEEHLDLMWAVTEKVRLTGP
jgi:hypothetical protein